MPQYISSPSSSAKIILHVFWRILTASLTLSLLLLFGGHDWRMAYVYVLLVLGGQLAVTGALWLCQPALLLKRASTPNHLLTVALIFIWTPIAGFLRSDWLVGPTGIPIILGAFALIGWGLCSNPFAIEETAIQEGQYVVETGPYAYLRHPIFTGAAMIATGTGLLLGAGGSLIAVVQILACIARARQEDELLSQELWRYRHYAARVRGML